MKKDTEVVEKIALIKCVIGMLIEMEAVDSLTSIEKWTSEFLGKEVDTWYSNFGDQIQGLATADVLETIYKESFFQLYKWSKEGEVIVQ